MVARLSMLGRGLFVLAACLVGVGAAAQSSSEATEVGEPHPFTCCDSAPVGRVIRAYLGLHEVLHRGEDRKAAGKAYALIGALQAAAQDGSLSATDREVVARLIAAVEPVKNDRGPALRDAFPEISRLAIHLALNHEGGDRSVIEAWCPGVGPWLQTGEPLKSPYADRSCARWR